MGGFLSAILSSLLLSYLEVLFLPNKETNESWLTSGGVEIMFILRLGIPNWAWISKRRLPARKNRHLRAQGDWDRAYSKRCWSNYGSRGKEEIGIEQDTRAGQTRRSASSYYFLPRVVSRSDLIPLPFILVAVSQDSKCRQQRFCTAKSLIS